MMIDIVGGGAGGGAGGGSCGGCGDDSSFQW